ncbi:MAG: hypothetical protein Q9210_006129 [Variospora velana]
MSPQALLRSEAVAPIFEQWKQKRFEDAVRSFPYRERLEMATACPHLVQLFRHEKTRKVVTLRKICASLTTEVFKQPSLTVTKIIRSEIPFSIAVDPSSTGVSLSSCLAVGATAVVIILNIASKTAHGLRRRRKVATRQARKLMNVKDVQEGDERGEKDGEKGGEKEHNKGGVMEDSMGGEDNTASGSKKSQTDLVSPARPTIVGHASNVLVKLDG